MAPDKIAAVKSAALASLPQQGFLYHGLEVLGGGSCRFSLAASS
jgi:adenine/guanine/hypoxanthine permease